MLTSQPGLFARFLQHLAHSGLSEHETRAMFADVDMDNDGKISLQEFQIFYRDIWGTWQNFDTTLCSLPLRTGPLLALPSDPRETHPGDATWTQQHAARDRRTASAATVPGNDDASDRDDYSERELDRGRDGIAALPTSSSRPRGLQLQPRPPSSIRPRSSSSRTGAGAGAAMPTPRGRLGSFNLKPALRSL